MSSQLVAQLKAAVEDIQRYTEELETQLNGTLGENKVLHDRLASASVPVEASAPPAEPPCGVSDRVQKL